jgi:NAD(P)-dependent dehydrogenase (short-subunit alcohol dehydrogenase family)
MDLQGKAALVTGASRGLGAALARELALAGSRVVLVARGEEDLFRTVGAIRAEGGDAHGFAADVADKRSTHAVAGAAASLVGPLELLVNNASTLGPVPLELGLDTPCEELERALAVNLVGPFRLIKAVAGGMVVRGHGLVLNVTSDAAVNAYPRWGAYGASKAALEHLTRTLAAELEGTGVGVLSLDPGEMDTRMHQEAMPEADRSALADPAAVARRIVARLSAGGSFPSRWELTRPEATS